MRVIVLTSDKYTPALLPFAHLFNKYWGADQEVVFAGFTAPAFALPDNFSFHSIGAFKDYPLSRWSDAVIALMHQISDEVFTLMLEDYWITRPVMRRNVQMLEDYMHQFHYVARMDLTGDRKHSGMASLYGQCGHLKLIWSDPNSPYHLSMMTGIWRKKHLLDILIPNESPWDVEIAGTNRLARLKDRMIVLGSDEWPVRHIRAFRGGEPGKLCLEDNGEDRYIIDPDDIAEMRALGLLRPWEDL